MSITVETLATKRVVDTRTDVNSYSRRTYQIFDGAQDTGYVRFVPNGGIGSGDQLNFTLNPPSTRVFVNRRVIIESTFEVTITGVPETQYLLNYAGTGATSSPGVSVGNDATNSTNGPRAYPLANATRSLQVSINNDQLSQNLGLLRPQVAYLDNTLYQGLCVLVPELIEHLLGNFFVRDIHMYLL
jgi:hypothetical protein